MQNVGLDESQAGLKIAEGSINNLRYADDTILMAESEEELKSLLMREREESEKAGLKLNVEKTKIMASGLNTSGKIEGEKVEAEIDFILLDSKTLTPWKESYAKPSQHFKKQRHHFADKSPCSQSYGFSIRHVWIRELDHKKGLVPKNWCFWIVMLEKTLENTLDIKLVNLKGNQP